ncbi:hypothetical protein Pcinc_018017 [Petrolisthes cinctipes]|uniref:Trafficking protein particle complex 12 n=1 Tax=Petrolisthes cinctipes TaxID=88211 RepID=A0AAE1FQ89_PETCI|nr:hypothetical protein Pcinc_018017 [Petrolisthes cinctipes]
MATNPFAQPLPSDSTNLVEDDGRSFFDQLSAQSEESEAVIQQHMSEALPVEAITSTQSLPFTTQPNPPHNELSMQPVSLPYNTHQPDPLMTQQPVHVSVTEDFSGTQEATMMSSMHNESSGDIEQPTLDVVPVLTTAPLQGSQTQNFEQDVDASNALSQQGKGATQFNIPLTPQYDSSATKDSIFNQTVSPETMNTLSSHGTGIPTQLTPVQSAMMMSMSTSMLVTNPSPNTNVDIEATTVKFQQASLDTCNERELQTVSHTSTAAKDTQLMPGSSPAGNTVSPTAPAQQKPLSSSAKPGSTQGSAQDSFKSKENESKFLKYFSNTKKTNPFESMTTQISGGGNDSAMINPVYMSPTDSFNISNAIPSPDSFLTPATEQDVFTASLLSSDADRRHDAWIPSESTRQALVAMTTSPPGTYFPEKELLTMPGIAVKEDFGDPVKNLVRTYLGEEAASKRKILTAASVTQDDRGLRQLIAAGCYHAAVNLTTQLLTVYGQGEGRAGHPSKHTAHSIQLWFTRIALLIKLRRFSLAEVECQYFGDLDAPDLYFEFYPELYGGRKGSMVPFGFRLLVAELPQHLGKHTQALDRITALLRTCDQIIKNLGVGLSEDGSSLEMTSNMRDDSLKLWRTRRQRVLYSVTNCAVSLKDFRLAGSLLERLIQEDPNAVAGLYSALGRMCLQLGDVTAAQDMFNQHLEHSPPPPQHDPVQGLLHSAYISIAQNAFKDASEILQQAHKINSNNGLVINNLAVCLMYTGRVSEAIKLMEGAIISQPERFLHEALVLNLATMYELESSNAHQKKLKLLSSIAQHKGDSFNVAALKLQPQ